MKPGLFARSCCTPRASSTSAGIEPFTKEACGNHSELRFLAQRRRWIHADSSPPGCRLTLKCTSGLILVRGWLSAPTRRPLNLARARALRAGSVARPFCFQACCLGDVIAAVDRIGAKIAQGRRKDGVLTNRSHR
jgi:hypothetical protein